MSDTEIQAQASLFAKLARVMGKLERLPKRGHNDHFGYDFVTIADVADAVRKALAEEGVAFFASMDGLAQENHKTVADFTFTFADGQTGATWTCPWKGEAMDTQDKGIAKAATSAEKYFLLKTLILSTGDEEDADGNAPLVLSHRANLLGRMKALQVEADQLGLAYTELPDDATTDQIVEAGKDLAALIAANGGGKGKGGKGKK